MTTTIRRKNANMILPADRNERVLRALVLFDHFKAFPAESELVRFCLKCAGCICRQRGKMSKPSSAWNNLRTDLHVYPLKYKGKIFSGSFVDSACVLLV